MPYWWRRKNLKVPSSFFRLGSRRLMSQSAWRNGSGLTYFNRVALNDLCRLYVN